MESLCLEFVNSEFREFRGRWVRDDLRQPEWLARFLEKWHLSIEQHADEALLTELIELRTLLTRIISVLPTLAGVDAQDLATLNTLLARTPFHYQAECIEMKLQMSSQPVQRNWDWVQSEIIVDFLALLTEHDSRRLKICQNPHCRGAFYDETKSRTRRYCSIEKCANLMKVRRFRARKKG